MPRFSGAASPFHWLFVRASLDSPYSSWLQP